MLDIGKMQLTLESRSSKVLYFKEDDIWFEAKPLLLYLDYSSTNVSQTLGLVRDKNKKSLKELLDTRGTPKMVDLSKSTPGYNELKASYVNEPGLYSLIFRSTKRQAQEFQDWVYEDVLTKLRQHGSYALSGGAHSSTPQSWVGGDLTRAPNTSGALDLERRADGDRMLHDIENGVGGRGSEHQASMSQRSLPEPSVTWKELGARREEEPAARGILESFLTVEEPGSRALQRRAWSSKPPIRFRKLAEGALHTAREALGCQASWPMQDGNEEPDKKKTKRSVPPEHPELDLPPSDAKEEVLLRVSEVMREAFVWEPVWKVYLSDLSNRMLQIKCEATDGAFSDRRPQLVAGALEVQVHKYTKPDDWPVACRALEDTKHLYEKRIREFLEEAFFGADLYDETLSRACAEAASRIAAKLRTQVGR